MEGINLRQQKISSLVGILCLSLILSKAVPVCAENGLPQVTLEGDKPVLVLPDVLFKFINTTLPDFRVPTKEDMTGKWATYPKKDAVPYACWGDFNGDGLTDIALILIGKIRWKLMVFNQTANGNYEAFEASGYPGPDKEFTRYHPPDRYHPTHRYHIYTLKAGQKLKVDGLIVWDVQFKFDTIIFSILGESRSGILFVWSPRGKYYSASLGFGSLTD